MKKKKCFQAGFPQPENSDGYTGWFACGYGETIEEAREDLEKALKRDNLYWLRKETHRYKEQSSWGREE